MIQVSNLTKQFKDVLAVDDLSFSVARGDVYGFLGQNGAGKSTTIRMLLTLIKSSSGRVEIFGKSIHTHREEILRNTGAMIEKPDLYRFLTAYENLSLFARISGVSRERSKLMKQLEVVGLASRAHSKVRTFSQGMKQRLGIAVALVHDPKLIILDEPTNGLDPQGIMDIRNLIKSLSADHGKTIVISSHLLSEIQLVANRILIIEKGKKIVEGTADELLDPAKTVVEIKTLNNNSARMVLAHTAWVNYLQPGTGNLILHFDKSKIPALIQDMVSLHISVLSVEPRNSLEDYFLSITNQNHVAAVAN